MPIDRAATLRNAEKLIRQGKLPDAIAEYVRLVEDQPGDWNLANSLGDLYARAGQVDKAIAQYGQIADSLNDEGAGAKAAAVYKKILKLKPDHEHTLVQVSEILGGQGRYADARFHLNTLIELRKAKGDVRGALQAKIRLGSLDPEDYEGRLTAAGARIEMGGQREIGEDDVRSFGVRRLPRRYHGGWRRLRPGLPGCVPHDHRPGHARSASRPGDCRLCCGLPRVQRPGR